MILSLLILLTTIALHGLKVQFRRNWHQLLGRKPYQNNLKRRQSNFSHLNVLGVAPSTKLRPTCGLILERGMECLANVIFENILDKLMFSFMTQIYSRNRDREMLFWSVFTITRHRIFFVSVLVYFSMYPIYLFLIVSFLAPGPMKYVIYMRFVAPGPV